ncbi:putative oxidoreductase [Neolecta irregularis DAH-3]|uniref:Putative oxidoreductase n=1 Tax=Neolecta irregularis (strain DAH-3) TaxID=1198029 RepID=A0A1U7LSP0_NEOID|nr:putative oxidoreductase [Neolecta irregularis DAH-3]|eukprot:OLL25664.1 putative oxidoreductase [Neolecta irregularis DAH-3]
MSREHIVIVGGGIQGASTAYYITHHQSFSAETTDLTLIEAVSPACAASGNAGGFIAPNWHGKLTSKLADLSWHEHQRLAQKHPRLWDYIQLDTFSVKADENSKQRVVLPRTIDWLDGNAIEHAELLEPEMILLRFKLTIGLLNLAKDKGLNVINGKVKSFEQKAESKDIEFLIYSTSSMEHQTLKVTKVIFTLGPWTSSLLPQTRITGQRAHAITIIPTRPTTPHAFFTSVTSKGEILDEPEIYARPDEVYVCGETDNEPLPETADQVKTDVEKCKKLHRAVCSISRVLLEGHTNSQRACYLPVGPMNGPLVGRVGSLGNCWIGAGHSVWGICLSTGTGLVLSEMVMSGKKIEDIIGSYPSPDSMIGSYLPVS